MVTAGIIPAAEIVHNVTNSTEATFKPSEMRHSGVLILVALLVMTRKLPQQRCSIGLSRGYVTAQFYVREQGSSEPLCVSRPFRAGHLPWKDSKPTKQDPNARAALAALEADLLAEGWERMRRARGAEWYELRFRREKSASLIRYAHQHG